jgi:hypothetical protein
VSTQVTKKVDEQFRTWLDETQANIRQQIDAEILKSGIEGPYGKVWISFPDLQGIFVQWLEGTNKGFRKPGKARLWILPIEGYGNSLVLLERHAELLSDALQEIGVRAWPESRWKNE